MTSGPNIGYKVPEHERTATRYKSNRHWSLRGDNTKGKAKK